MPIPTATLEQQFSSLTTEDVTSEKVAPTLVTPTKERDSNSSLLSDDDTCGSDPVTPSPSTPDSGVPGDAVVTKTDHKLKEERGELAPEPLLVENPHRFVIFPISDNDVSVSKTSAIGSIRIKFDDIKSFYEI